MEVQAYEILLLARDEEQWTCDRFGDLLAHRKPAEIAITLRLLVEDGLLARTEQKPYQYRITPQGLGAVATQRGPMIDLPRASDRQPDRHTSTAADEISTQSTAPAKKVAPKKAPKINKGKLNGENVNLGGIRYYVDKDRLRILRGLATLDAQQPGGQFELDEIVGRTEGKERQRLQSRQKALLAAELIVSTNPMGRGSNGQPPALALSDLGKRLLAAIDGGGGEHTEQSPASASPDSALKEAPASPIEGALARARDDSDAALDAYLATLVDPVLAALREARNASRAALIAYRTGVPSA